MAWHVYEIGPIDLGWHHLKTVEETAIALGLIDGKAKIHGAGAETPDLDDFVHLWRQAQDCAREKGWDGDFRNKPAVFWLPGDSEFECGFVIKQDNNGITYVVSPQPLPHLERD